MTLLRLWNDPFTVRTLLDGSVPPRRGDAAVSRPRHIFRAPARFYKTGVVFMACSRKRALLAVQVVV